MHTIFLNIHDKIFYFRGKGRIIWGISYNGIQEWGGNNINDNSKSDVIVISSAESTEVQQKIKNSGWNIESLPGAGHKLLKVAAGRKSK